MKLKNFFTALKLNLIMNILHYGRPKRHLEGHLKTFKVVVTQSEGL
jgi:hypothetical protein